MKLHQNTEKIHSGSWTKLFLPAQTCHIPPCTNPAWEGIHGAPAELKALSAAQQLPVHLILMCLWATQLHASSRFLMGFCGAPFHDWEAPCVSTTFPWLLSPGTSPCHRWFCFLLQGHKRCSHAWGMLSAPWAGPQSRMKLPLQQF